MGLNIKNRRYIGNKSKLLKFIDDVIKNENIEFTTFGDVFSGTGVVAEYFLNKDKEIYVNDLLFSNYVVYKALLSNEEFEEKKIEMIIDEYNKINSESLEENYFSNNFSGNYYHYYDAKKIGYVREDIENKYKNKELNEREYYILISALLYSMDKISNTVGHYESFLNKEPEYKNLKINYIINRSIEIIDMLKTQGLTEDIIIESAKKIIESQDKSLEELFTYDFLYYESFFMPYNKNGYNINFIQEYIKASEEEKKDLYSYIQYNWKNGENENKCIIAKKFQIIPNQGNYDKTMLIDDARTLYVSKFLVNIGVVSFDNFIDIILDSYENIENFNRSLVKSIIYRNIDVFQEIYYNVLNINEENNIEEVISENEINLFTEIEGPEPRDDIEENENKNHRSSSLKKEKAKRRAGYLCELGDRNHCKYFTSKVSNKNYVEAHHLIQMEFSNDFENSIDVIANLISLCPNCHRRLHHAKDEDRKGDIEYLFLKRKDQLEAKGISISLRELKDYYNIEE